MSWRIAIKHSTGYRYQGPVESSYNEARLTPLTTQGQTTLDSKVEVRPPATVMRYWDYWGTLVHAFDIHVPHTELLVTAEAVVETSEADEGDFPALGWPDLTGAPVLDRFGELLAPTRYVPRPEDLVRVARDLSEGRSPREACDAVVDWVRDRLRYEKGTTTVASSAADALAHGAGVCQDFAHLALAVLRAMGLPARYVSGYLHPLAEAEIEETMAGESHAWVEAWVGDWVPLEPTIGTYAGSLHVIVGRGRDYADVAPLRGIYHGGPCEALGVTVELTRLA